MTERDLEAELRRFDALVGKWTTTGTHPMLPDVVVEGRVTFEWLEGERFLIQRSRVDHESFPDAIAITGIVDGALEMHYFDSRGVQRVYAVGFEGSTWTWARDASDLSQRFTGTLSEDGQVIHGVGRMSRDGQTWEDDLQLTYRRVPGGS